MKKDIMTPADLHAPLLTATPQASSGVVEMSTSGDATKADSKDVGKLHLPAQSPENASEARTVQVLVTEDQVTPVVQRQMTADLNRRTSPRCFDRRCSSIAGPCCFACVLLIIVLFANIVRR